MEPDSDSDTPVADWGKSKHDYYFTDYVDKDYPSKLTAKEEKLAAVEEEEALRVQRKLLATLDDVNLDQVFEEGEQDLIGDLEERNKALDVEYTECKEADDADTYDEEDEDGDGEGDDQEDQDSRRPINMAMMKNRGLTPYKKKVYRNPRVKHKLKYQKAMSKRRRNVREVQSETHRYSGETSGIKTSTIKSVRLC